MTRKNLIPNEDLQEQSWKTMKRAKDSMEPRQFRDALTRANGAVTGVKTHVIQSAIRSV